jgi:hypothetical protein
MVFIEQKNAVTAANGGWPVGSDKQRFVLNDSGQTV